MEMRRICKCVNLFGLLLQKIFKDKLLIEYFNLRISFNEKIVNIFLICCISSWQLHNRISIFYNSLLNKLLCYVEVNQEPIDWSEHILVGKQKKNHKT